MSGMLILFDIDATLLHTHGAGRGAITDAGLDLFGAGFDTTSVRFDGSLDALIFDQVLTANGLEATPAHREDLRALYREKLITHLGAPDESRALPGVFALLERLEAAEGLTLGLLTGNFPETGAVKLRASGLDPDRFVVQTWGDDSPHDPPDRAHLPPVAMERYRERLGRPIEPQEVVVIGDTVHDVRCASTNDCRSLAVATGYSAWDDLVASEADRVVHDLSDTDDIVAWITR